MRFSWTNPLKALSVLLLLAAYASAAFGVAGNVQFVTGDVKLITRTGETRALVKGATVNEGDRIVTAAGASAQIKMIDGGFIAVRPDSDMAFDTYRYSGKEDGSESAIVSLLRGGFRTITGIIGRTNKQNYLIKTETATIGIRGTDHEPMVVLPPAPGQVAAAAPGTYDKVNVGIAYIRNDAGSVDIHRNQVGFAPVTKAPPAILPRIPPFYKPTPAPVPQKAKEEPKDEGKKDTQQAAAAPAKPAEEQKAAAPAAAAPAEKAAEAPAPIRTTAVVDPTTVVTTAPAASTPTAAAPVAAVPVVAITATDASGSIVNTTTQTVTTSSGVTTPVSEGTFALQAQAAADAAAASATALNALVTTAGPTAASTTPSSAVSAAQPAVTSASTAGSSISAMTINTGLAASNTTAAAALANTAASQTSATNAKYTANGAFADATIATPALAALNAANATLQTANSSAQSAATTVTTQNSALTTAQSSAAAALTAANQALSAANTAVSALTAAGVSTTATASSLLADAQSAASAAQAAADQAKTLQNKGDSAGAQAQLIIAQQQAQTAAADLANANKILAAIASAASAQSSANSITAASTGLLATATSAQTAGASAVSSTSSQLATAQAQAPIVQQNSVLAQYSNPAVASSHFGNMGLSMKPVTGGAEWALSAGAPGANTNYVLDGNKSLVEVRNGTYARAGWNYLAQATIANADIKYSGGVAMDLSSDPNGTLYMGRWQGGQVAVTDLAASGAVAPFTDALGPTSAYWLIGLSPGNSALSNFAGAINNVQTLAGSANYSLAAATHPTDALGNVGTLNSASLGVNFSSQTLNAALSLSFSSTDPANVSTRNLSLSASTSHIPITSHGFGAVVGTPPNMPSGTVGPLGMGTMTCTGASCASGGYGGIIIGGFGGTATGTVGSGAALDYMFTPIITSAATSQPLSDLIQGNAILSTSTAPTVGVTNFSSSAVLRQEVLWPTTQIAAGVNPTTTTYIVSDKNKENLFNNSSGTPSTPLTTPLTTPVTLTGPTANTNYLFDASGNLVRVFDTPHVVFDLGNDVPGSSTQFSTPTPLAHVQLSFGGGGATAESYFDSTTNVRLGRWTGGLVNVTDLTTGASYIDPLVSPAGAARSVEWVVAQMPSSLPLTGEFQYTRINGTSGTPSFATAPTDSYGNVGTINGARLSADFTNMRASAGVRISMPSGAGGALGIQNLSAHFENAPITSGGFNVSTGSDNPAGTDSLHVGCFGAGCAPDISLTSSTVSAYGGRIRGAFDSATGNAGTADGAFFRYTFNTLYGAYGVTPPTGRVVDDYINGLVAFQQGPQITLPTVANAYSSLTAPTGPVTALAAYSFINGGNQYTTTPNFWVDQPSATNPATGTPFLVTDASGNLKSIAEGSNQQHGNNNSLTLSGGTASPATPVSLAIGSTANASDGTILLGWQQASPTLTVTGTGDSINCFDGSASCPPRTLNSDGLSWVRGPAPFPDYLPGAIAGFSNSGGLVVSGAANYSLGASIVHDQTGAAGTVTASSLGVNFSKQFVNFSMTATTPTTGTWTASANGIRLGQDGNFFAYTPPPTSGPNPWTVVTMPQAPSPTGTGTVNIGTHDAVLSVSNPSLTNTFGNISGQLMGIGLGGAGLTFALNGQPSGCASSSCTNFVNGALGFTIGGIGPFTTSATQPYSTLTAYQLFAATSTMTNLSGLTSTQLSQLGSGNLTDLTVGIRGGFVSPYRTQTVNNFPVMVDSQLPVLTVQTPPSSCTGCIGSVNVNDVPVVYAVTGATSTSAPSVGTATLLESGYDVTTGIRWGRYGNGTVGVNDRITGASLGTVDLSTQNSHFILTTTQSGPTVLPLSGTFNYTLVGGTTPTDSKGNVGTPLTSANASLSANFSTQKVDVALTNIVVGPNTWGASATGIPISGNFFGADKKIGGGGSLTVTSSLGTNTAGSLGGVFTGATGAGAAMLYSLNQGGNIGTNSAAVTVSGTAVFKR